MSSGLVAAVLAASAIGACGGDDGGERSAPVPRGSTEAASRSRSTPSKPIHSLPLTLRCLERRRLSVDRRLPTDPRLRALRDLAQRTSVVVQVRRAQVGLAVASGISEAELLVELLRAPGPYRILRRRNAVVVYRRAQASEALEITRCLRPAR